MSEPKFAALAAEIEAELAGLAALPPAAVELRPHLAESWIHRRAAGSVLHDFYNGAERVFERVARTIERDVPDGPSWHAELLRRMALPIHGVRPAVLTPDTVRDLRDYLRFRHVFRNLYGEQLRRDPLDDLVGRMPALHERMVLELEIFVRWLLALADET
jgi:hypothetical protein